MTKELKIMFGIGAVVIVGALLLFWKANPQTPEPVAPQDAGRLVREKSYMTGKSDAKVTVVEFGDFECPVCAKAEPLVQQLRQEYKDNPNVNIVFRHFPLPQHKKALPSAEAAEAAGEQGKFWEMHDLLYQNQSAWIGTGDHEGLFVAYAQQLGLDVEKFKTTWRANSYRAVINTDAADGAALGVQATPTFFVNGEKYEGAPSSYDAFKKLVEDKLK